jgi:hypothetical protein
MLSNVDSVPRVFLGHSHDSPHFPALRCKITPRGLPHIYYTKVLVDSHPPTVSTNTMVQSTRPNPRAVIGVNGLKQHSGWDVGPSTAV